MFSEIVRYLSVPTDKPELAVAQFKAFRDQAPLLYIMLIANTAALSLTHMDSAPWFLTHVMPALLYALCGLRIVSWTHSRRQPISSENAVRNLRRTVYIAVGIGMLFSSWAISLFPYGGLLASAHVVFFISISIVGSMFCMMHLRGAAVLLTIVVLGPFSIFLFVTDVPVFRSIAVNIAIDAALLAYVINNYYNDFAKLIDSRKQLQLRQAETERLLVENQRLANLDSLTGLGNRRWFVNMLEEDLGSARRHGYRLAIGIIDLDGFKPVNDAYGHSAGDRVLIEVARRLQAAAGEQIRIARLGGDEFGFIISTVVSEESAVAATRKLMEAVREPYLLTRVSARVDASAGVAIFPDGGRSAEKLFEHADYALFQAKRSGRGSLILFTSELATEIAYQSVVEQQLKSADLDREFSIMFQPLWSESETRTFGFEALARWNSSVLGSVRPDVFVPVAERCGMMGRLTETLFAKALHEAENWPGDIILCCNLSAKDVSSTKTLERLLDILEKSGFNPSRLVLELTETAMLDNLVEAYQNLERIRALGIGLALDDFGVGHSSLSQVHRLPITKIKIDQSFIGEISSNQTSRNIVRTIIDLARNLGCSCIVEGVETAEQSDILNALGCDLMQGYYFGKPLTAGDVLDRLANEGVVLRRARAI
jgi:diguanylate cyclase (GGDEF)-like protein